MCVAVITALEWTGDGYEWNPAEGDYRERPLDAIERHAKKIRDELKSLKSQLSAKEDQIKELKEQLQPLIPFKVGDLVRPSQVVLHCGSGIYDRAVVVSLDPFVLISELGDMRWNNHIQRGFMHCGKASDEAMANVTNRIERDKREHQST
jgi:hypothetical protein